MSQRRTATAMKPSPGPEAVPVQIDAAGAWRPNGPKKDVASPERMRKLAQELAQVRHEVSAPLIKRAVAAINNKRFDDADALAKKAVTVDEHNGYAWYVYAICKEKLVDYTAALLAYERALGLIPDNDYIAYDLGRLAALLKLPEMAEKFLSYHILRHPESTDAVNDLACSYRDQSRFDEAIELLKVHISGNPEVAALWNTLGSVMFDRGEPKQAMVFYDEAIRLDPNFDSAYYNRANAKNACGDIIGALRDCEAALKGGGASPMQNAMMRFSRSNLMLVAGQVGEGWDAYDARNDEAYIQYLHHVFNGDPWRPGVPLAGRRVAVIGEQGLGDEVLFANLLPDVIREVGPEGAVMIAVEPRLVPLFQRSFPSTRVVPHVTRKVNHWVARGAPAIADDEYDVWARMGDLLRRFRRDHDSFPTYPHGFLTADPERVEHWRGVLAEMGPEPKVGVIWKSLLMGSNRVKFYSPFELWEPVLKTPGVTFINLQIGDCADDLKRAEDRFGVEIRQPPGIDLKLELDDLAALCRALDLTVGPATATTNIAGAVGAPTWFISTPDAWPRLGTDHYPWYRQARAFSATITYDWPTVMRGVADALRAEFPAAG